MSIEDYFDPYGDPDDRDDPEEQRCKYCGTRGLYFEGRDWRWILVDEDGNAHAPHCKGRTAKRSEFPALEDDDGS
jgi:hypothetical protein